MKGNFEDLINSEKPVLVDFFATWCGPCQMLQPVLEDVASRIGDKATIVKIDVDKNPEATNAYKVQGVPTLILFKKGEIKWRQSGFMQPNQLMQILSKYL
jgi:thioredoxin 1